MKSYHKTCQFRAHRVLPCCNAHITENRTERVLFIKALLFTCFTWKKKKKKNSMIGLKGSYIKLVFFSDCEDEKKVDCTRLTLFSVKQFFFYSD